MGIFGNTMDISVVCVINEQFSYEQTEQILAFEEMSNDLNVNFTMRTFNSLKHYHDKYNITHLPSFHIYHKKRYITTVCKDIGLLEDEVLKIRSKPVSIFRRIMQLH